jgi:hypothetical protein
VPAGHSAASAGGSRCVRETGGSPARFRLPVRASLRAHGPRCSIGSSRTRFLPCGSVMSDLSLEPDGSDTSAPFCWLRRLAHDNRHAAARPRRRGPNDAMRPTALRADDVYAGTERPGRIERKHSKHLTSFPSA